MTRYIQNLGWAILIAWPCLSSAQITPGDIDQANRNIERVQQEQRDQLEREREQQRAKEPRTSIEVPTAPVKPGRDAGPCRDIKEVHIGGSTLMPEDEQKKITEKYAGKCLAISDIESLLGAVTSYYINRGYIAARAYVQTQDLGIGVLRVLVVEGKVESLQIEGKAGSVNLQTAFPGVVGQPLNLRDFEQGLDQINRLSSNKATMELQPGVEPGASRVVIKNEPDRRLSGNVTFDSFGGDSTGRYQVGANAFVDNLIGLNDGAMLTHRRTTGPTERHSHSTSALLSVPLGYWTATASYVASSYATPVKLPSLTLVADGSTDIGSLQLEYVAYRDQINRVSLSSTLTFKDSENFLAGQKLETSSRQMSNLEVGAAWSTQVYGGALSSRINMTKGLSLFGSYDDPAGLPKNAPRAQFQKFEGALSWSRPFNIYDRVLVFGSSINSQWSKDVLYGMDQFLAGSVFSVRGFRSNSLSGDIGYYMRNDLSAPTTLQIGTFTVNARPYLGLDHGHIYRHANQQGGALTGTAAGVAINVRRLLVDVQAVRALSAPDNFSNEGLQWYASMSYRL